MYLYSLLLRCKNETYDSETYAFMKQTEHRAKDAPRTMQIWLCLVLFLSCTVQKRDLWLRKIRQEPCIWISLVDFHSSLLWMQFSDRQVYYTDRAYNYPIVRIERVDNPPVNMRSLWDAIFGSTAPFNGSSFFVDPCGLNYGFFGSCQLERTRNIHVCLLH